MLFRSIFFAAAIRRMLNFNQPVTKSSNTEPQWKILIYDRCGQDIISPLLSVKELRDTGITLHQQLHSDRESIPDVPAIYIVLPTEDNIKRISKVRVQAIGFSIKGMWMKTQFG